MKIIVPKKSHFAGRVAKVVKLFQDGLSLGETSKKKISNGDLKMKRDWRNIRAWRKFWESCTF